ncbi:MAG: FHIPEP family type III secretion protein [Candidatus Sericytochromatia bacterium]|nr:FHIPEP family type III secretion protein [Candidatus Sericytochromatia bacterium]
MNYSQSYQRLDNAIYQLLEVPPLILEIGLGLFGLVDPAQGSELLHRLGEVRLQIGLDLGLVMPPVLLRENPALPRSQWRILLREWGAETGHLEMGCRLALLNPPAQAALELIGQPGQGPNGEAALWLTGYEAQRAERAGLEMYSPASVLLLQLQALVKIYAHELLSLQAFQHMLEHVRLKHPALVEDLIPHRLPLSSVRQIMQNLLEEGVSIRDLPSLLEALSFLAQTESESESPIEVLSEALRRSMGKSLLLPWLSSKATPENRPTHTLQVLVLEHSLEKTLFNQRQQGLNGTVLSLNPLLTEALFAEIDKTLSQAPAKTVVLVKAELRRAFKQLVSRRFPNLAVFAEGEIPRQVKIEVWGPLAAKGL